MSYLSTLNDEQRAVVYETEGIKAVVAGSGSGKTRVIIAKVIHLIRDKGVLPSTIWVCTFTKKAKEELVERLSKEVGASTAKNVKIGTLHSISFSIYKNGLMMTDGKSKYSLPKPLVNEGTALFQIFNFIRANEKKVHSRDGKDFLSTINIVRMHGVTLDTFEGEYRFSDNKNNRWCYNKTVYEVWKFYEKWKVRSNYLDFADMIVRCYEMLKDKKYDGYVKSLQRSCKYLLIDEIQDNNSVNYKIADILSGQYKNLMMTGDLKQCIYSFQGASPDNLINFVKNKNPKVYNLKMNYRSTKTIVDNANDFIHGCVDLSVPSVAFKPEGMPIKFCTSDNESGEAQAVASLVDDLIGRGYQYSDIAILYRVHSQSVMLESYFLGSDVPYVTLTANTFFDKREIKDIITYLRAFQNPDDVPVKDFKSIVGRPNRYISSKATKAIEAYCEYEEVTFWEALNELNHIRGIDPRNKKCLNELRGQIIAGMNKYQTKTNVTDLIKFVLNGIGYESFINGDKSNNKTPDGDVTMDFDAIISLVNSFDTIEKFFKYVDKVKEQEAVRKGEKDGNYLQMMTMHACITGETLVNVNGKTMMIKDAPNTGKVLTPNGMKTYTNKNKRKKSKVIKISTKSGYKLNMTVDHGINVFTKTGSVRVNAEKLKKGDIVRLKLGTKETTKNVKLTEIKIKSNKQDKKYRTPKNLNEELAEFLGMFVADGTLYKNGYRLVKRYKSTVDRFGYLSNKLFGTNQKTKEIDRGGICHYYVNIGSTYLSKWLSQFEFIKPNNKNIPLEIVNSPRGVKCAFLKGFAEDGSVVEKDGKLDHIRFNSTSYNAIFNAQYILREMGLVSTIKTYKTKKQDLHSLYISGMDARKYANEVGSVAKERQCIIDNTITTELDRRIVPITIEEYILIGKNFPNTSSKRNAKSRGYVGRTTYKKIIEKLNNGKLKTQMLKKLNWHYDKIESFETSKEETYCFTVPDGGKFLQNGFDAFNSKGKEFPVVITLGNCTRIAPFHRNDDREEEKRLMYVAITRPEKELYVSVVGNKLGRFKVQPSPFLFNFKATYNEDYSGKFYSFD